MINVKRERRERECHNIIQQIGIYYFFKKDFIKREQINYFAKSIAIYIIFIYTFS